MVAIEETKLLGVNLFGRIFIIVYLIFIIVGPLFHIEIFPITDFRFYSKPRDISSLFLLEVQATERGQEPIVLNSREWRRVERMSRIIGYGNDENVRPFIKEKLALCLRSYSKCVALKKMPIILNGKLALENKVYEELHR